MLTAGDKPTIRGERVLLRPITIDDAPAMYASTLDAETMRLTGTQATFTPERIEAWCAGLLDASDRVDLAILDRATGSWLGEVVLNGIDFRSRGAGFRIALSSAEHFGKGYGSEATRLMLRYGFATLGLHRIELEVYAFNPRAIHVYEKLGFRREGVRRDALFMDGAFHDAIQMGILEDEFSG